MELPYHKQEAPRHGYQRCKRSMQATRDHELPGTNYGAKRATPEEDRPRSGRETRSHDLELYGCMMARKQVPPRRTCRVQVARQINRKGGEQ